jgi:SIR2-like domain
MATLLHVESTEAGLDHSRMQIHDATPWIELNGDLLREAAAKCQMTWFMGTGVTANLLNASMASLPAGDPKRLPFRQIKGWDGLVEGLNGKLTPKTESKDYSALDQARHLRQRFQRARQEALKWPKVLTDLIGEDVEQAKQLPYPEAWRGVFEALQSLAMQNGGPMLVTTNYDDLFAHWLGVRVLYRQLGVREPRFGRSADRNLAPALLRQINSEPEIWKLHEKGWLGWEEAFVHHLHGWWNDGGGEQSSSIVFDPGDYRQKEMDLLQPLSDRLRNSTHPVLFIGAGEGLFDPHLMEYWDRCRSDPQGPQNYWLLIEEDKGYAEMIKKVKDDEWCDKLEVIKLAKFADLPAILSQCLTKTVSNCKDAPPQGSDE